MCRAEKLCCFNCLEWFDKGGAGSCEVCGDWNCPRCGSCLCSRSTREQKIAIAYIATYENLLREITEESYDYYGGGLTLAYSILNNVTISLQYRVTFRASDVAAREYAQNLVGLLITYNPK